MLAHGADRLEEPEWESGSFFFVKIKCLPRNRMLTEKQNTYRYTEVYQNTECLPGNEKHTQENSIFTRNRTLTEIQNKKLPDYLFASFDARGRRG